MPITLSEDDLEAVSEQLVKHMFGIDAAPEPVAFDLSKPLLAQVKAVKAEDISWQEWLQVIATVLATIAQAFEASKASVEQG